MSGERSDNIVGDGEKERFFGDFDFSKKRGNV